MDWPYTVFLYVIDILDEDLEIIDRLGANAQGGVPLRRLIEPGVVEIQVDGVDTSVSIQVTVVDAVVFQSLGARRSIHALFDGLEGVALLEVMNLLHLVFSFLIFIRNIFDSRSGVVIGINALNCIPNVNLFLLAVNSVNQLTRLHVTILARAEINGIHVGILRRGLNHVVSSVGIRDVIALVSRGDEGIRINRVGEHRRRQAGNHV